MKRFPWFVATLVFFASTALSETVQWDRIDCTRLSYDGQTIASVVLPGDIARFLEGDNVSVTVSGLPLPVAGLPDSLRVLDVSGQVKDGRLVDVRCEVDSAADFVLVSDAEALQWMANEPDFLSAFKSARQTGRVRISANGFFAQAKLFFLDVILAFK